MRSRALERSAFFVMTVAMAACSGRHSEHADAGVSDGGCTSNCHDDPIPATMVGSVFHRDLCAALIECRGFGYSSVDHCMQDYALLGEADFQAALAAGQVQYDAAAAGECHARFAADACEFASYYLFTPTLYELLTDCHALVGLVPAGSPCIVSEQCVSTAYCDDGAMCPGTCVTRGAANAPCTWTGECAEGLSCGSDDLCHVRSDVDGPCTSDSDCVDPLRCEDASHTCGRPIAVGEPCVGLTTALPCEYGLFCTSDDGTPGTCVARGGVGATCTNFGNGIQCKSELDCYEPNYNGNGTCSAPSSLNGSCNWGLGCASDLRCVNTVCVALAGLGESCSTSWGAPACADGLACDGTTCLDARVFGETCGPGVGTCSEGICVGGVCVARGPIGATCSDSDQCATGNCGSGDVCIDGIGCN